MAIKILKIYFNPNKLFGFGHIAFYIEMYCPLLFAAIQEKAYGKPQ